MFCEDAFSSLAPHLIILMVSYSILSWGVGKGIRKVNRMKPPVTLKNSMLRREILQKVLLIEQYTIRSCSSCQSFHASWLTPPLCIMFLDGNLVCRSTKLAQEILFIWTPPLVGFDKLNFVECSLSNLG